MTEPATLQIEKLEATVEGKPILKGIDLVVKQGETHALMGPNGSGKSTLANVLMGRPGYTLTAGRVLFKGEDINALEFRKHMKEKMKLLGVEDEMVQRYVNQGFSGGEKKKNEILQLAVLEPEIAVLDETDSGLDIDSLKAVANGVAQLIGPDLGVLLITHYQRILNYITPDFVHVMIDGRIVKSGGKELAHELEEKGYEGVRTELDLGEPVVAG